MRLTLTLLLTGLLARSGTAQTPADVERHAYRASLWGTLIPVTAGTILWASELPASPEGKDRTGAALLIAGGLTFGPSFGYSSAGLGGRGLQGIGLRAGLTLLSFGSA